ncbi:hypothetical protein GGF46_001814 [Coemansia sp. RSA 552]|nr:hypothetical protein GGF46_001814 [Coemansia sp. RSA 552]
MVTDPEGPPFDGPSHERQSAVEDEFTGFISDSQLEDNTEELHLETESISDIGRAVSQGESGMDFTTHLAEPMDGVRKPMDGVRKPMDGVRKPMGTVARALPNGLRQFGEDVSLSRLADSYWRSDQQQSGSLAASSLDNNDDLQSMEFSTQSAERAKDNGVAAAGLLGSFSGRVDGFEQQQQRPSVPPRLGSVHSDMSYQQSSGRVHSSLARRPESYHAMFRDGEARSESYHAMFRDAEARSEMFDGPSGSSGRAQPLPTFSSTDGRLVNERPTDGRLVDERPTDGRLVDERPTDTRLARVAARYFDGAASRGNGGGFHDMSSDAMSEEDNMSEPPYTPDVPVGMASGQYSAASPSPSPPPPGLVSVGGSSIVARTQTALQRRFASMEESTQDRGELRGVRAQSQPGYAAGGSYNEVQGGFLANHPGRPPPLPLATEKPRQAALTGSYQHVSAFSMDNQSTESLDHPNMGSQGTFSPGNSLPSLNEADGFTDVGAEGLAGEEGGVQFMPFDDEEEAYGSEQRYASVQRDGLAQPGHGPTPFDTYRTNGPGDKSFEELAEHGEYAGEEFTEIRDPSEMFGDHLTQTSGGSSNPNLSDIKRDHEQLFADLFEDTGEGDVNTISNEFDPTQPPASLFASSASIVNAINGRKRNFSTWDGREATPEAMRRQEQQYGYGADNPIEMLGRTNSLGISENSSDVSGLLPDSPPTPPATGPPIGGGRSVKRGNARGLALPGVRRGSEEGVVPLTPKSAPLVDGRRRHWMEPTTPTTFVSRDRVHGPVTRVLRQLPPFEPGSSRASTSNGELNEGDNPLLSQPQPGPNPVPSQPRPGSNPGLSQPRPGSNLASVRRPAGPRALDSAARRAPSAVETSRHVYEPSGQRNARAAADFARSAFPASQEDVSEDSSQGLGSLFQDSLPTLDLSRVANTPTTPFHALSRAISGMSGSSPSTQQQQQQQGRGLSQGYVPFQEPTVDIDQLARYGTVDMREGLRASQGGMVDGRGSSPWAHGNLRRAGVSADRMDSPAEGGRRLPPVVSGREIGVPGFESDDQVPTVKYGSSSGSGQQSPGGYEQRGHRNNVLVRESAQAGSLQPNSSGKSLSSGPTLADVYELLKEMQSAKTSEQQSGADKYAGGFPEALGPLEEEQQYPEQRPSAPTPRRSRHGHLGGASEDGFEESLMMPVNASMLRRASLAAAGDQAGSIQARFQEYLDRRPNDSMVNHAPVSPVSRGQPTVQGVTESVESLGLAETHGGGDLHAELHALMRCGGEERNIPLPLAEKLLELATVLAKRQQSPRVRQRAVDSAMQTTAVEEERGGPREEVMGVLQDILARFDEYREEVTMLRAEVRQGSSVASAGPNQASGSSMVAPHDSVSFAAAADVPMEEEDAYSQFESPRPSSEARVMHSVPNTAKNRQRHMVQWLNRQDGSYTSPRRRGTRTSVVDVGGSPQPRGGQRRGRPGQTTVEDVDEEPLYEPYSYGPGKAAAFEDDNDEGSLSDASTTVPGKGRGGVGKRRPIDPAMIRPANDPSLRQMAGDMWEGEGDLLETRQTLEAVRRRSQRDLATDQFERVVYSRQMAEQLAKTLAQLQRAHLEHFHHGGRRGECPVCGMLRAQDRDPYLFGRHAVAYKSMTTRELQALLNAYVAAMEEEVGGSRDGALGYVRQDSKPVYQAFTSGRGKAPENMFTPRRGKAPENMFTPRRGKGPEKAVAATHMVIELLREELGALSRRYHRMVGEYQLLDPSNLTDQRRRRQMARELKDLVDLLDVKGEQIAVLASLHPSANVSPRKRSPEPKENVGSIQHAFRSAKVLQQALGDLY